MSVRVVCRSSVNLYPVRLRETEIPCRWLGEKKNRGRKSGYLPVGKRVLEWQTRRVKIRDFETGIGWFVNKEVVGGSSRTSKRFLIERGWFY